MLDSIMDALGNGESELSRTLHDQLCNAFIDDLLTADLPFKSLLQNRMLGR